MVLMNQSILLRYIKIFRINNHNFQTGEKIKYDGVKEDLHFYEYQFKLKDELAVKFDESLVI